MGIEDKLATIMHIYLPVAIPMGFLYLWYRLFLRPHKRAEGDILRSHGARFGLGMAGVVLAIGLSFAAMNVESPLPRTRYADGYTRYDFNRIRVGDPGQRVFALLGSPLAEVTEQRTERFYADLGLSVHTTDRGPWVVDVTGPRDVVKRYRGAIGHYDSVLDLPQPDRERSYTAVQLVYSERIYPGTSNFWVRTIYLNDDKTRVIGKRRDFATDL